MIFDIVNPPAHCIDSCIDENGGFRQRPVEALRQVVFEGLGVSARQEHALHGLIPGEWVRVA